MENLSVVKTKESTKQAFYHLLSKTNYKDMKVKDICEYAAINRGTFYYHFDSKEALVDEIINEYIQSFIIAMESSLESDKVTLITIQPNSSAYNLFHCCSNYAEEISILLENGFDELFKDKLYKTIHMFFSKQFIIREDISGVYKEVYVELKTNQLVFGIMYFIKNSERYSPKEFAEIYTLITKTTTKEIMFVNNK